MQDINVSRSQKNIVNQQPVMLGTFDRGRCFLIPLDQSFEAYKTKIKYQSPDSPTELRQKRKYTKRKNLSPEPNNAFHLRIEDNNYVCYCGKSYKTKQSALQHQSLKHGRPARGNSKKKKQRPDPMGEFFAKNQ